jgi:hypothetical protein
MTPMRDAPQAQARPVARAAAWAAPEPYGPMPLSPAMRAGLAGLRLALGLVTAMAVFTFVHGLHG